MSLNEEGTMQTLGIERYRKNLQRAIGSDRRSQVGGGRRITSDIIPPLSDAIASFVEPEVVRAGRHPGSRKYIALVEPGVAAFIAARTVFDAIGRHTKLLKMASIIGARIEDEVRFRDFKKQSPKHYRWLIEHVNKSSDYRYKHRVMVHASNRDELVKTWKSWSTRAKVLVGKTLIDLMMQSTGMVKVVLLTTGSYSGRNEKHRITSYFVIPTEAALERITKADADEEVLSPWYLPMTEEPTDWTNPFDGGYKTMPLPLVKGRSERYNTKLSDVKMPSVYAGINRLQRTAWRVNRDVLCVLDDLWNRGLSVAGLPEQEVQPPPEKLGWMTERNATAVKVRSEIEDWQAVELKMWKAAAARIHVRNARRESKIVAASKTRDVAHMFEHESAIYFPHQCDWRGRAYAAPLFLQPQGNDIARGLLEFAGGKAFGTDKAIEWWMVHGSNCWGFDKAPFVERMDWICDHAEEILAVHNDPISELWWAEAADPWQFLAFCLEFGEWTADGESTKFVSHLPVSMDGSCNGLQHLSALMLDEIGAEATNLLPGDKPQDLYQRVCDVVTTKVEGCALMSGYARQWLKSGLLTRDVVKRQVMTRPYGGTQHGMVNQLTLHLERVRDKLGSLPFESEDGWEAVKFITPLIWDAINEVVSGAQVCMDFLRSTAQVVSKRNVAMRWTAPTGFPVQQAYVQTHKSTIKTQLLGKKVQLKLRRESPNQLDKRKQASGISPNFIHALDASHMYATIQEVGEVSLAMVHDSFGTHAADAEAMARCLRSTFVDMYQREDLLAKFLAEVGEGCPDALPELPKRGSLDLGEVKKAMFFFA